VTAVNTPIERRLFLHAVPSRQFVSWSVDMGQVTFVKATIHESLSDSSRSLRRGFQSAIGRVRTPHRLGLELLLLVLGVTSSRVTSRRRPPPASVDGCCAGGPCSPHPNQYMPARNIPLPGAAGG